MSDSKGVPVRLDGANSSNVVRLSGVAETLSVKIDETRSVEVVDPLGVIDQFRERSGSSEEVAGSLTKQANLVREIIAELGGSYLVGGDEHPIGELSNVTLCIGVINAVSDWCSIVGKGSAPAPE